MLTEDLVFQITILALFMNIASWILVLYGWFKHRVFWAIVGFILTWFALYIAWFLSRLSEYALSFYFMNWFLSMATLLTFAFYVLTEYMIKVRL